MAEPTNRPTRRGALGGVTEIVSIPGTFVRLETTLPVQPPAVEVAQLKFGFVVGGGDFLGSLRPLMPLQFAMFARENSALRGEIAGLRGETAALRAEIIELRRVLVAATSVAISVSPAVPTIQDADLSSLVGNYLGVEDLDVRVALSTHPHLVKTLQEARARIAEYFGDDASVRLRAPSSEDAELFAQIRPRGLEVHEALDRMEDFSEKWWLLQPFEARRWLEFSVAWGA